MEEIKLGIDTDDLRERAPDFRATFMDLGDAMKLDETKVIKREARLDKMTQQPSVSSFTPSSAFEDEPKSPDQPTHPSDPNYSGSSTESKPEGTPNVLIADFIKESIYSFGGAMRKLTWPETQNVVRICFLYVPKRIRLTLQTTDSY